MPCVFFKHSQVRNPCRAAGILHHRYLQLPLPSAQLWYFWPVGAMEKCHGTATSELTASTFLKKWQRNLARTWICLRLPPPKKKHVRIYYRFPISNADVQLRKLTCHLQQTSPKVEAPTPTSALVILFPLPFDIRPPMAGEARELRGEGAIWCTWRVVAVVAVRYFGISFKTFP